MLRPPAARLTTRAKTHTPHQHPTNAKTVPQCCVGTPACAQAPDPRSEAACNRPKLSHVFTRKTHAPTTCRTTDNQNKDTHTTPTPHQCQNCTAVLRWHTRLHTRAWSASRDGLGPIQNESQIFKENARPSRPPHAQRPNQGAQTTPAATQCQNCAAMLRWCTRLPTRA